MASVFGGTEEFWTNSPVSHKRSLGGRQGERAVLGYSWYCFRNFICAELDIACGSLGSPRSTKAFECWSQYGEAIFKLVLSCIMPPAQQTPLQTPANEVSLMSVTRQGLAVWRISNRALQASGGCPGVSGRAGWLDHSWKATAGELTVGSSF